MILFSPESFKSLALSFSRNPLVVKVMSKVLSISDICLISLWRSVRSKGSPPVIRILFTPKPTRILVRRVISSKLNISSLGRNWYLSQNISEGMQYGHRKLHRSVTEIRMSCKGRLNLSINIYYWLVGPKALTFLYTYVRSVF